MNMRIDLRKSFVSYFTLQLLLATCSQIAWGQLQAGASTSNITPAIGRDIIGGFAPFASTNIHDELCVRTLVLKNDDTTLVFAVCDLLGIDRKVSELARDQILKRHGIPKSNVLISATHTHSASSALGADARDLDQQADEYQLFVVQRILDGVTRALARLEPAEIAFGSVDVPEHVHNRRWLMKPGSAPPNPFGEVEQVKMNPPRGSTHLVEPAGPIDPQVSVLAVRRLTTQEAVHEPPESYIAIFAAYSLHYVGGVPKGDVSADYFRVFSQKVASGLADESEPTQCIGMLANGTSGDINNIDFTKKSARKPAYEQINYVGTQVAQRVIPLLPSLNYSSDPILDARYAEPTIQWRQVSEQRHAWAKKTLAAGKKSERDLPYLYAQRTLKQAEYPATTTAPLQVVRIGDTCIGTMPFEVFAEIGLEFRANNPFPNAFMVELAHGYFGYLPTQRHFRLGGYETWLGTNRVVPETADVLLEKLLQMAAELKASEFKASELKAGRK